MKTIQPELKIKNLYLQQTMWEKLDKKINSNTVTELLVLTHELENVLERVTKNNITRNNTNEVIEIKYL